MGCGVGQSSKGTQTGDRGQRRKRDRAEGMRKKGRSERRRQEARAAPTRFSLHRKPPGSGPAAAATRRASPASWPRRARRSISGFRYPRRGWGRAPHHSQCQLGGGGYCEEGRRAHLKFRDICSPREETLGARRLGAPAPPAPSAVPGAGLPHHPPAPPFPHPRSHQRWLAEQGGGGAKHGIGLGVEFGSCCPTDRSSKGGESGPGGGLCKAETLKRRVWRAICQNRSPQNTHRPSPT